jgi:hypothetical protein
MNEHTFQVPSQYPVVIRQRKGSKMYSVQYGAEIHSGMTYQQAATKLGECLMHALACNGAISDGC